MLQIRVQVEGGRGEETSPHRQVLTHLDLKVGGLYVFSRVRYFPDYVFHRVKSLKMMLWLELLHPSCALARGLEGSECR